MTIRLLTDWPYRLPSGSGSVTIPAGAVVSVFDAITETGMIAQKLAVLSAAAVTWTPPSEAKNYDELSPSEVAAVRTRLAVPGDGKFQRIGSLAVPLSTLSLAGATGAFVLPVVPTYSPGQIAPHSRVRVDFRFRRTTAVGALTLNVRLGTTGTAADSQIYAGTIAAAANQDIRVVASADFGESLTAFSTHSWGALNALGSAGPAADRSANIDTSAVMYVSADVSGGSAGDTINLIAMQAELG